MHMMKNLKRKRGEPGRGNSGKIKTERVPALLVSVKL
jgi:hypothetical protein